MDYIELIIMIKVDLLIFVEGQFPYAVEKEKRLHQTSQNKTNRNNKVDCVSFQRPKISY